MGGPKGLMQYLVLQDGTSEKLANANAKATQGLALKIIVWNNGQDSGQGLGNGAGGNPIRDLYASLPPLLETMQMQTGIMPPALLAQMPQQKENMVNGNALRPPRRSWHDEMRLLVGYTSGVDSS